MTLNITQDLRKWSYSLGNHRLAVVYTALWVGCYVKRRVAR